MRRAGISWKGIISVLNLILLIFLYLHLISKESEKSDKEGVDGSASNSLRTLNISYKDSKLHDQKQFIERVGNKRAYSMSDAKTYFLACISDEQEANNQTPGGNNGIHQLKHQIFACMNLHIPIEKYELDSFKAINTEHKYFLPMDKEYYNNSSNKCLYLTVGIGNSTKAEKEFLKLYPKCNLYGVEIAPSNVDDFGTFGKIINAGIGFDGKQKIVDSHNYGNQISYNVTVKPLDIILDQEVGSRIIHYATIDIEGSEYEMLAGFEDLGQYHTNGIVICQMDIEFHLWYEVTTWLHHFFHNAYAYLPAFAAPYEEGGMKVTLINIKNSECELAFRFSKYFER